jgi:molybdate transport system regulatory protein
MAISASGLRRSIVEVDDAGIIADISSKGNFDSLIAGHSLRDSYPDFRLRIAKEKPFYGPGVHHMLELTAETGSLRDACRRMGVSYGKGRGVIAQMEQQLGYRVLKTQQGGKTGGYSTVTDRGKDLMRRYAAYCADASQYLQGLFYEHFPE